MEIETIRALFQDGNYIVTEHFEKRMDDRRIKWKQVERAIERGKIVEERPKQKPYPEFLLVADVDEVIPGTDIVATRPLYIVGALGDEVYLISCDWNPPREWGQKVRRRR